MPDFPARRIEQLGSKPKFWIGIDGLVPSRGLFKQTRSGTGEAWAERVSADLAELLGLPHALYDLAVYAQDEASTGGTSGVISWTFRQSGEALIHGNEILCAVVSDYPKADGSRFRRIPAHTVDRVLGQCATVRVPDPWEPVPPGIENAADVMVGYLLFDAWIANTDRHDENWGWIADPGVSLRLAPTYDHSSSLGRNEPDDRRAMKLRATALEHSVEGYALRAPSGLYGENGKQMRVIEAFRRAAQLRPAAASVWLGRLARLAPTQWETAVARVPDDWITPVARRFAIGILSATRKHLLAP